MKSDYPVTLETTFSTPMNRESNWWLSTAESLEAKLASGGGFVAETDSRIVGCVMYVISGTDFVLRGLTVRLEFENRGIDTVLVEMVETKARAQDLPWVLLAVSAPNLKVCDYYLCLGYVVNKESCVYAASGCPVPVMLAKEL